MDRAIARRRRIEGVSRALAEAGGALLSERDRALLAGILAKLSAATRTDLAAAAAEAVSEARHGSTPSVGGADLPGTRPPRVEPALFGVEGLVEQALYRAMAHGLSKRLRAALNGSAEGAAVGALLQSPTPSVAEAAKAYLVDEARRVDGYQDPILRLADLSTDQRRALLWHAAADLRLDWTGAPGLDPAALDGALEAAARRLAGAGDAEAGARPSLALAAVLEAEGTLDPAAMVELLREGEVTLFEALVGIRSGLDPLTVRRLVFNPDPADLVLVCQATGQAPDVIESICGLLGAAVPDPVPDAEAGRMLDYWRRDPAYRDAVEEAADRRAATAED